MEAESNSMQDPYAIENDDYRYDDDPYARFQANKSNGRGSVMLRLMVTMEGGTMAHL